MAVGETVLDEMPCSQWLQTRLAALKNPTKHLIFFLWRDFYDFF